MAKLFTALVIAAIIAAAAILIAAQATTKDISMIECQDRECRLGCRTIGKIPEDKCHTPPFQHGRSMMAVCSQAPPTGLCYYFGSFRKNDTTGGSNFCTDANAEFLDYHQCGVCRPSFHKPGTFEKTTCTAANNLTFSLDCDAGCGKCNHTHSLQEKTCFVPPGDHFPFAIEVSAPAKCAQVIQYAHYNNSGCNGTAEMTEKSYSGVCFSFEGRSHLYQCA